MSPGELLQEPEVSTAGPMKQGWLAAGDLRLRVKKATVGRQKDTVPCLVPNMILPEM